MRSTFAFIETVRGNTKLQNPSGDFKGFKRISFQEVMAPEKMPNLNNQIGNTKM